MDGEPEVNLSLLTVSQLKSLKEALEFMSWSSEVSMSTYTYAEFMKERKCIQ